MKKLTMADIALQAGVAKSTVSRYFNGGYVKEETKERIRQVIEKNNYEPSAAAQNLKLKYTKTIGIVAPTMTSTVTGRQLMAIDETLRQQGYMTIIINTDHDAAKEIEAIEKLRSLRADGIILIATTISEEHQKQQQSSDVPFLVMGQQYEDGVSVVYDDYRAGLEVGKLAADYGHTDVMFIGVSEVDDAVGRVRKQGVLDGLKGRCQTVMMEETTFSYNETRYLIRDILQVHIPTLFICATDRMAMAAYKEVRDAGLRVPEDVSIIGFGAYDSSELMDPSLLSVRFHNEEAGIIAARTLINMIYDQPVPSLQMIGHDIRMGGSLANLRKKQEESAPSKSA